MQYGYLTTEECSLSSCLNEACVINAYDVREGWYIVINIEKASQSTEPESRQTAKISSSSSSDRLVQNCMTLSHYFSHKSRDG